jgi:hypothetical protein
LLRLVQIDGPRLFPGSGLLSVEASPVRIEHNQYLAIGHHITRLHQPLEHPPANFSSNSCFAKRGNDAGDLALSVDRRGGDRFHGDPHGSVQHGPLKWFVGPSVA